MRLASLLIAAGLLIAQDTRINDDLLYDKVREKLATNRDIKGGGIEVEVKDGVVTLRGKVVNPKHKTKAEQIAKKVKGVKKVVNELETGP